MLNKLLILSVISLATSGCGGGGGGGTVNTTPNLAVINAQTTNEDTAKSVTLVGTDADGDALTYSAATTEANITITNSGAVLTLTPAANQNGTATIIAKANDGIVDSAVQSFVLTINAVNDVPTLAIISAQTANQGVNKVISISASDADSDSLTYTLTSDPVGKVTGTVAGSILTIKPADTYSGTAVLTLTASDSTTSISKSFNTVVSGDPLYQYQWHLNNTGQTNFATTAGTSTEDINVDSVIADGLTGTGIIVAVVDEGLEITHEDLVGNVVVDGSKDFVGNDTDPTNPSITGDHGTSVAGLIASKGWNGKGGRGVAPSASLKGFNFLKSQATQNNIDSHGAASYSSDVAIFNQSYGGSNIDDSLVNTTIEAQFLSGVTDLRSGKGAVYIKSSGNGFGNYHWAIDGDGNPVYANCTKSNSLGLSCQNANMDPYNTLPYNITVGALNATGVKSSYSTAGSAIWASAPGGEYGTSNPAMMTTDQTGCNQGYVSTNSTDRNAFNNSTTVHEKNTNCKYTSTFNGTSSAAPVLSGAIALMLEANPNLTWRDVKHILATTSDQVNASIPAVTISIDSANYVAEPAWLTNSAGHKFHNYYGFGRVNVASAVAAAKTYVANSLGTFATTSWESSGALNTTIPDNNATGLSNTITTSNTETIEAVQIKIDLTHTYTGELAIELTSPSGTKSVLFNAFNGFGTSNDLSNMVLLSNAFYGESATGDWQVKIIDAASFDTGILADWSIRFFGH